MNAENLSVLCEVYLAMEKSFSDDFMSPGYLYTSNMLASKGFVKSFKFTKGENINDLLISKISSSEKILLIMPNNRSLTELNIYAWEIFDYIEDHISPSIERLWWDSFTLNMEVNECYLYYL